MEHRLMKTKTTKNKTAAPALPVAPLNRPSDLAFLRAALSARRAELRELIAARVASGAKAAPFKPSLKVWRAGLLGRSA
jgi:hypothetical protein